MARPDPRPVCRHGVPGGCSYCDALAQLDALPAPPDEDTRSDYPEDC